MESKPLQRLWEVLQTTQFPHNCSAAMLLQTSVPNGGFGMQVW